MVDFDIEQGRLRDLKQDEFYDAMNAATSKFAALQTAVTQLLEFRQEVIDNDDGLFIPTDLPKVNLRLTEFVAVLDQWRATLPGG